MAGVTPTVRPLTRGDVVLAASPFTDLSATKRRPAVIIGTDTTHGGQGEHDSGFSRLGSVIARAGINAAMKIDVTLERASSNGSAYAPDLDDVVVATGTTREETVNNFRDALRGLIRHKHQEGLPVPDVTELEVRETVMV